MSSLNLAPKSTAPKVPRDLPFGALLTTYISSPTTPLFTTLSFTVQMRHLDDLRSHNTGVAEQELLNVPGSEARLLVDVPKNLMKLCGSGKGVRFSTKDITEIKRIAERIGEAFGRMDGAFKGLNVGERKGKGDEADSDGKKAFVGARDEFLECYKSAVLIAAVKREELAALKGIVIEVDPEAEMKQARPMCEYLEVLIDKYSREQEYKPMSLRLDSLARFSAFCAACYVGEQVFLSPPELSALETLIDASADEGGGHTERYWRERFFKFLSKMREIKSVPKKEAKLHDRLVWKIN